MVSRCRPAEEVFAKTPFVTDGSYEKRLTVYCCRRVKLKRVKSKQRQDKKVGRRRIDDKWEPEKRKVIGRCGVVMGLLWWFVGTNCGVLMICGKRLNCLVELG